MSNTAQGKSGKNGSKATDKPSKAAEVEETMAASVAEDAASFDAPSDFVLVQSQSELWMPMEGDCLQGYPVRRETIPTDRPFDVAIIELTRATVVSNRDGKRYVANAGDYVKVPLGAFLSGNARLIALVDGPKTAEVWFKRTADVAMDKGRNDMATFETRFSPKLESKASRGYLLADGVTGAEALPASSGSAGSSSGADY